ncbi:MAG: hypothetical protein MRZ77_05545 [Clostridiales bacterium]|nr:hypothetical protein [Clostridiales bacterium]
MSEKERNYLFDNLKAFLITSTVFAHLLKQSPTFGPDNLGGHLYFIIFSYIMEGFILISGYFSKNTVKCRDGAVKNFLLPYIFFVLAVSIISMLICGRPRGNLIVPSFALWFMFAMFVFRVTVNITSKIPHIVPIALVMYFAAGCLPLNDTMTGSRICCFFLFYIIGYKMEWKHFERIRSIGRGYILALAAVLTGVSVAVGRFGLFSEGLLYLKKPYANYGLSVPEGIVIRLVILVLFFGWLCVMVNLMPQKKTFFSDIGRKTVTVYILHIAVRYLFMYTPAAGPGGVLSYIIALLTAPAAVWLFSREPVFRAYNYIVDTIYRPVGFVWKKIRSGT